VPLKCLASSEDSGLPFRAIVVIVAARDDEPIIVSRVEHGEAEKVKQVEAVVDGMKCNDNVCGCLFHSNDMIQDSRRASCSLFYVKSWTDGLLAALVQIAKAEIGPCSTSNESKIVSLEMTQMGADTSA
jgi:hypothetical protein